MQASEIRPGNASATARDWRPLLSSTTAARARLSLGYLGRFSLDKRKIDRSFIRRMNCQNQSRFLVSTSALLFRKLGLDVVAEGVENEQQVQMLLEPECPRVQGYLYSRPLALGELDETVGRQAAVGCPTVNQVEPARLPLTGPEPDLFTQLACRYSCRI